MQFCMTWSIEKGIIMVWRLEGRTGIQTGEPETGRSYQSKNIWRDGNKQKNNDEEWHEKGTKGSPKNTPALSGRIPWRKIPATTMVAIGHMFVQVLAKYAIHVTAESNELHESWDNLEKGIVKKTLGIYWERKRVRLRETPRLDTLGGENTLKIAAMRRRLRNRPE